MKHSFTLPSIRQCKKPWAVQKGRDSKSIFYNCVIYPFFTENSVFQPWLYQNHLTSFKINTYIRTSLPFYGSPSPCLKVTVWGEDHKLKLSPCYSSVGKESACNAGNPGSIPGSGRSPGEGIGYQFQYSGLENSMDYTLQRVGHN